MTASFLRTLTGKTLLRLALAGGLLLFGAAVFNATLLYRQSQTDALQRLAAAVAERARVAERVLGYTVETHETVRLAFAERWPAYQDDATTRRLDTILQRYPDGVWRNRPELADGSVHPTGWVPAATPLTTELKRLLVLFWDLSTRYGPGAAIRRDNLFFMGVPEQSNVGYDPYLFPNWVFDIPPDFDQRNYEWGRLAYAPARPGTRSRYATPLVDDIGPGPGLGPIFQVLTPVHVGERHIATVATTLRFKDFLARTMPLGAGPSRYLVFKPDGRLLADTREADPSAPSANQAVLDSLGGDLPGALLASTRQVTGAPVAGQSPDSDLYYATARIDGPDWYVAATLPGAAVRADAWRVALWGSAVYLGVLLALLALLAAILRRQVAGPLGELTQAAERVAGGDMAVRLPSGRDDELGRLALAFNDMAGKIAERDATLRQDKQEIEAALTSLRLTEERWRAMTDNASDFVAVVDAAGALRYVSPPIERMLGRPPEHWVGRSVRELVLEADAKALVRQIEQPDGSAIQCRAAHADGRERVLEAIASDLRGHPAVGGIVLNIRDVSEAVGAERQLRQAQKLEAIGTLAGGIAHDFNNILAAILGYGEMALKDAAEGGAQRRHIESALGAGLRAKSLVERILAFSRSGVGERVPVHVQSVVAEALDGVSATLPRDLCLHRELRAGDAAVLGDPTQVHQVVLNLCANAVQAMKGAGALTVVLDVVHTDAETPATTRLLPAGSYVRLRVEDSGSGIDAALAERIFDPFFTTKEVGVGTGLGLSLVHGIVTELGGGIDVESRVGAGSRFTVYLPWHGAAARPVAADEPVAPGNGETVLLVDDEEALVRLGEEQLAELGYEAVGFASSAAALEAFRAAPDRFQALLTDEAMPGMTGSELVAEVRRLRPGLPIVLMSGYVTPALAARAREAGVAEVLNKPLVARDIARGLAAALQRGRPGCERAECDGS